MYIICVNMMRFCIERKFEIKFFFDDASATFVIMSSC